MRKEKLCAICGKKFVIENPLRSNKRTCSSECSYNLALDISKRYRETIVNRKCKECSKKFQAKQGLHRIFCSMECQIKYLKENRKGKENPSYRNGTRVNGKSYSKKHMAACRKNRRIFLKENDYLYCELCQVNQSPRFETHHIVFASEAPNHKELHNPKNLILLCIGCHNKLHCHKYLRNELVIQRGLNELFNRNLIIQNNKK